VRLQLISPIKILKDDHILLETDLGSVRKSISLGILNSIAELVALVCSIPLMESIAKTDSPIAGSFFDRVGVSGESHILVSSLVIFLFGQVGRFSVLYFKIRANAKYKRILSERISNTLYGSYLFLKSKSLAVENSSANSQNVINAIGYVNYRVFSIVSLISEVFTLLLLIVAMCLYSPLFILPVIGISGVAAYFVFKLTINKVKLFGNVVAIETKIRNRILNESLRNIDEIQVFGNQTYFQRMFCDANEAVLTGEQKYEEITTFAPVAIEISAICVFSVIFGFQIVGNVSAATLLATIGILFVGALRIIPSLGRIVSELQKQSYGLEARLAIQRDLNFDFEFLCEMPAPGSKTVALVESKRTHIHVSDLEYRYANRSTSTFTHLSFCIDGETLFGIKGRSGSGKSTLLRLLLGIYHPRSGQIIANGVYVNEDLTVWRSQVGYVPQSIFFIDGTVRENIVFGSSDQSSEKIFECLEKVGLIDFITSLPNGLETYVGESGELFSGGQRQRIGIARALFRNPSVLIMDEPTSALDVHATSEMVHMLKKLSESVLVLVASHDEILLKKCDEIVDLDDF
jgi:ABC-type multidrug transport system fused ATPase/permease subunit